MIEINYIQNIVLRDGCGYIKVDIFNRFFSYIGMSMREKRLRLGRLKSSNDFANNYLLDSKFIIKKNYDTCSESDINKIIWFINDTN